MVGFLFAQKINVKKLTQKYQIFGSLGSLLDPFSDPSDPSPVATGSIIFLRTN